MELTPHYKAFDILFDANFMQRKQFWKSNLKTAHYSYIIHSLKNGDTNLLATDKFCKAIVLSELWDNHHALAKSNSRYYFNPYTLKIEPILSDQGTLNLRDDTPDLNGVFTYHLEEIYQLLMKLPEAEYRNCISDALRQLEKVMLEIEEVVSSSHQNFHNDPIFDVRPLYLNLKYLNENFDSIFLSKHNCQK